jgi:hypothetical protein
MENVKRKFLPLSGLKSDHSVVQPVARRYTDYAIPNEYVKSIFNFPPQVLENAVNNHSTCLCDPCHDQGEIDRCDLMISGAVGPLPPIHRFGGSSSTSL